MTTGRRLALAWVVSALFGCGASGRDADSWNARDSSGVEIIVSEAEQWVSGHEWRVAPQPLVDIGAEEGPSDAHLFRVRDAVRWRNSVVVINGATDDLLRPVRAVRTLVPA